MEQSSLIKITNLKHKNPGEYFVQGKIENVQQTSGPTVFTINDGYGSIEAVAFMGKGERAYPNIKEGDTAKIKINIGEDQRIRIENINKFEGIKAEKMNRTINEIINERIRPPKMDFLIQSEALENMRTQMNNAAREIRKAVINNRPIIIRHHADTDGYVGAIALERAIVSLMEKHYFDPEARWKYFNRAPSKSPFYEYGDVIRDLSFSIRNKEKFEHKEPLVLLVDNGSTDEDLLSIKKLKIYNSPVVVVDHHHPGKIKDGKSSVDNVVDFHVNPYLFGYDRNITAGMLGTELARLVDPKINNIDYFPALSGVADVARGEEMNKYLDLAKKHNLDREYLKKIGMCVDFEAHFLKFLEGYGLVDDLLGENHEKHKDLVELLYNDIIHRIKEQEKVIDKYMKTRKLDNGIRLGVLDAEKVTSRGQFPPPGKTVGIAFDRLSDQGKTMVLGIGPDFIIIRATEDINFDINELIKNTKEKIPYASIQGGGHENAGTLKFVEAAKEEVVEELFKTLGSNDYV